MNDIESMKDWPRLIHEIYEVKMFSFNSKKIEALRKDPENKFLWAMLPIIGVLVQMEDLYFTMEISKIGFHAFSSVKKDNIQTKTSIEEEKAGYIERRLDFAQKEIERDFQILNRNMITNIWTYLESSIKDLLGLLLINDKEFMQIEELQKIKIPLALYSSLDDEEQIYFIIEEYERQMGMNIAYGPKRLIKLLEPFGLKPDVSPDLSKSLFELAQVRNLLLHNNSIVDLKFKKKCPWLTYKVGKRMIVSEKMIAEYSNAVSEFSKELLIKIAEYVNNRFPDHYPPDFQDFFGEDGKMK